MARNTSRNAWGIYSALNIEDKRVMGTQFVRAVDSIGANIAEGFGRFHFLDKNRFNYNARGSLFESIHWLETLHERNRIDEDVFTTLRDDFVSIHKMLNSYISITKNQTV